MTSINEDAIRGADVTISIDSVVTLEKREFSTLKTVLLGIGGTGTVLLILSALLIAVTPPVTM